ncbi:MAG: ABC transporter substrate-binding protein [Bryobacterales bacterium]|nr:ABC transporter substrate-binding protein [Bryobacteraceae bacterium]MDW8355206.1 ABC transporter substrate-binding protein [Bryobacterales bacterium]
MTRTLSWLPSAWLAGAVAAAAAFVAVKAPRVAAIVPLRASTSARPPDYRIRTDASVREATDRDGRIVRMARPVRGVVSQFWSIDEFVYTIVPPERVKGVSESAYQARISNVLEHVRRYRPIIARDPEQVLLAEPDLVFVSSSARADYTAAVRSTGLSVFRMHTWFRTLEEVEQAIVVVGHLTGHEAAAARERALLREAIERARRRRPAATTPPRVLGLGGRYSYGSETLFHDILKTLGAVNVGAEGGLRGYDPVSSEQIAIWNPDWIVCGADPGRLKERVAQLLSDPAIAVTAAGQSGRILVFENRVFSAMSPYVRLFLDALGAALYEQAAS